MITLPTWFTLFRFCIAPFIMPYLFLELKDHPSPFLTTLTIIILVSAALSDWFDGYLARKWHQETILGKIFDQIADKFLWFSCLIGLVLIDRIFLIFALVLISRECFVTGLRLASLEQNKALPVLWTAKLKTVFQFLYLISQTIGTFSDHYLPSLWLFDLESTLLLVVLLLSLYSAKKYYDIIKKDMQNSALLSIDQMDNAI